MCVYLSFSLPYFRRACCDVVGHRGLREKISDHQHQETEEAWDAIIFAIRGFRIPDLGVRMWVWGLGISDSGI